MRYAVLCVGDSTNCAVVADGEYEELLKVLNEVQNIYGEDNIKLIDYIKEDFSKIKNDASAISSVFGKYFIKAEKEDLFEDDNFDEEDTTFNASSMDY